MAKKKKKVNKTQAIKDALESSSSGSPSEIAESLTKSGIKVSAAYVSTVKSDMRRQARKGKSSKRGSAKSGATGDLVSIANLLEARKFADRIGGIAEARHLLEALKKLELTTAS